MRQHLCLLATAVLSLTGAAAQAADLIALSRTQWSLYYDGGPSKGHLEIEIAEKSAYASRAEVPYEGFLANVAVDKGLGKTLGRDGTTVQEVVIRYVESALKEDHDQVLQLYAPGTDQAKAIAETKAFKDRIGGLREVVFLHEWLYMDSRFVLAEFRFDGGESRKMGFGFRNTPKGFLLSHEWSDDEGVVMDALHYLVDGLEHGWWDNHSVHPDEYSIPLGEGLFGISLMVDGELYEKRQDWTPPGPKADASSLQAFAERVLAMVAATEETAADGLWCSEDMPRLAGAFRQDPDPLAQMRWSGVSVGGIKHVLTMAFGDDFVHYFVEETKPTRIRSLFIGREDGGFCLSSGPGDRRVQRLLQSDALSDGIWSLWIAQRAS